MKHGFLLLTASVIAFSTTAYGQSGNTLKTPEKVSSAMIQKETTDTTHHEAGHKRDTQAAQDTVAARDFATIRAEVRSSTTAIVIKALALAVAIIGLGVVYLPRKKGGHS